MSLSKSPRIGLLDDHAATLSGLREMLMEASIEVAWTSLTADGLESRIATEPVDVLVADFKLESGTVLDYLPDPMPLPVVIYSAFYFEDDVRQAFRQGAMAWIRKSDPLKELIRAIQNAAQNRKTVNRSDKAFFEMDKQVDLSDREREVLQRVYEGQSNEEIAQGLQMEVTTVKSHLSSIFSKLGAASRSEAVHTAICRGIITTPDETSENALG